MSQHSDITTPISSIKSYVLGFSLSLALTLAAFAVVYFELNGGYALMATLLALAAVQALIQLRFFLHVGDGKSSKWNAIFFFNTLGVILLIVIASIWVMNSLNYRMMSPEQMEKYMLEDSQRGF